MVNADMTDIERQREHFNQISERYRQARSHPNHVRLKELIWAHFLSDKAPLQRDGLRVLEAMCGYGEGHDILSAQLGVSLDYEGFDYSDDVVAFMNQRYPERLVTHRDVTTYEPRGEAFDVILLCGGLHHVPNHCDEALQRMSEALKPGGYMINLEPTHGTALTRWVRQRIYERNALFDEQTERAFEVDEYFALFARHGFEIADVIYPGLLSYVLYYNPDAFPALNHGPQAAVEALFALEKPWLRTDLARSLSFATLAMWRKPS